MNVNGVALEDDEETDRIAKLPPLIGRKRKRKLVLHFDIRNTILVADSVTNILVEQALNSYLTGVTWGHELADGSQWEWLCDTPTLKCPTPGAITYYKHLEHKVVTKPSDRSVLRQLTGDFTQIPLGKPFASYYEKHLKLMQWPYTEQQTPDKRLMMYGQDNVTGYHYIQLAYFNLVAHLHATKRDFAIVIRTYGMDAPNVLQCSKLFTDGKHPGFPKCFDINVETNHGSIHRSGENGIVFEDNETGKKWTNERDIYRGLSDLNGIFGYVDHFSHWQNHGYSHKHGKPLWFDPNDTKTHHILFDDNIRTSDNDNIVNMRLFEKGSQLSARSLDLKEASVFENICMVQADLLAITENPDYYINKVTMCEQSMDKYMNNLHILVK